MQYLINFPIQFYLRIFMIYIKYYLLYLIMDVCELGTSILKHISKKKKIGRQQKKTKVVDNCIKIHCIIFCIITYCLYIKIKSYLKKYNFQNPP